jgi:hypothetical protein
MSEPQCERNSSFAFRPPVTPQWRVLSLSKRKKTIECRQEPNHHFLFRLSVGHARKRRQWPRTHNNEIPRLHVRHEHHQLLIQRQHTHRHPAPLFGLEVHACHHKQWCRAELSIVRSIKPREHIGVQANSPKSCNPQGWGPSAEGRELVF